MKKNRDFLQDLCFYAKYLSLKGLIVGSEGNLSVRRRHGFWITPSGKIKENLDKTDVIFIRWEQEFPEKGVSSEWGMHKLIYLTQPKARAIVHTHPFYVLLMDAYDFNFKDFALKEVEFFLEYIEVIPFLSPGSKELWEQVAKSAQRAKVIVLKRHGLVVWDTSLEKAVNLSLILEKACKFNWYKSFFNKGGER